MPCRRGLATTAREEHFAAPISHTSSIFLRWPRSPHWRCACIPRWAWKSSTLYAVRQVLRRVRRFTTLLSLYPHHPPAPPSCLLYSAVGRRDHRRRRRSSSQRNTPRPVVQCAQANAAFDSPLLLAGRLGAAVSHRQSTADRQDLIAGLVARPSTILRLHRTFGYVYCICINYAV